MLSVKEKLQFLDRSPELIKKNNKINSGLINQDKLAKINAKIVGDPGCFYILREKKFPLNFSHGDHALQDFLEITPRMLALITKDSEIGELFPQDFIFYDTETTGLAGGSGTCIFLLGVGFYYENNFIIKQFYLPDYKNEEFFLNSIRREFKPFKGLISYNGKSYDFPLLKTRFIMNRMPFQDFEQKRHVDLLHSARRLWKKSVGGCSLQSIEKNVLGFARQNDVPGGDIPDLYFNYLRTKQIEPLVPVFKHNVIDILSMTAIAARAAIAFHGDSDAIPGDSFDLRAVFHSFAALGDVERALLLAESAENENETRLKIDHGLLLKRTARPEKALQVWTRLLGHKEFIEIAYLELAKYYEHTLKTYTKALSVIDAAINRIEIAKELHPDRKSISSENWDYRRQRVLQKIRKQRQKNDH